MQNFNKAPSTKSLPTALNYLVVEVFLASALIVFIVENIEIYNYTLGMAEVVICALNLYDAQNNYIIIRKNLKHEV